MNEQSHATGTSAAGALKDAKSEVQRLAADAKDETKRVAEQATQEASDIVDRTKQQTVQRLGNLAGALRQAADQLDGADEGGFGRYAGMAADQVQRASGYLQTRQPRELLRDTETFARRHPDLFLGGAFVAGVMLARFLKSSAPEQQGFAGEGVGDTYGSDFRGEGYGSGYGYGGSTGAGGASGYGGGQGYGSTGGYTGSTGMGGGQARGTSFGDGGPYGATGGSGMGMGTAGSGMTPGSGTTGGTGTAGTPRGGDDRGGL